MEKKVFVIGAGITGLTTAYYLQKAAKEENLPIDVTLVEATDRIGGQMQTVVKDGFVIERGPDSFLVRKESASRLIREVGLGDELVRNATGQSYVVVGSELHKMPEGSFMGIPTQAGPFIASDLFSWKGKLRAGLDYILPHEKEEGDQSVGNFFRKRLGNEVVENLIEPLLSGIYSGHIDRLSLRATFPQFEKVVDKNRSLILGMKDTMPKPKKAPADQPKKKEGIFYTVKTGLESVAKAIGSHLDKGSILLNTPVASIEKQEEGYKITTDDGRTFDADDVVLTVPHHVAANILKGFQKQKELSYAPLGSVATIAMAFDQDAVQDDVDGTGFVVSRNSDYTITACTWTHRKWPHSTPEGKVLLRCFVGRADDDEIVDEDDDTIVQTAIRDLNKVMTITKQPEFSIVTRWKKARPQYVVAHNTRIEHVEKELEQNWPNVYIAGSSYHGAGIPDCIDQGEKVVQTILEKMR